MPATTASDKKWGELRTVEIRRVPGKGEAIHFLMVRHPRTISIYSLSFQSTLQLKTSDFNAIRTWIVGVEGELADHHTTTTTAPNDMGHGGQRSRLILSSNPAKVQKERKMILIEAMETLNYCFNLIDKRECVQKHGGI